MGDEVRAFQPQGPSQTSSVGPGQAVQTVLGPVPADTLGATDAHTHVLRTSGPLVKADSRFLLDSVENAVLELKLFRQSGGGSVVDMTPTGPGRDPAGLAQVAARSGVQIIGATGFVKWALSPGSWLLDALPIDLASFLIDEITAGFDCQNGARSRVFDRTSARAGVIKIATSQVLSPAEERFAIAGGLAHLETGAPISVHTEKGEGAFGVLKVLTGIGIAPDGLLFAHTFLHPDDGYLKELAATGAFLIVDGMGKPQYGPDSAVIRRIHMLVADGFGDQLLLGTDFSKSSYWKSYGGSPGFDYLLSSFLPELCRSGIEQATVETAVRHNPGRAFRMRKLEKRQEV